MKPKRGLNISLDDMVYREAAKAPVRDTQAQRITKLKTLLIGVVLIVFALRVVTPLYNLFVSNLPVVTEMRAEIKDLRSELDSLKSGR